MYTKLVPGQIIFYFPHKLLFENVQHQSAFMCKNIVSKEGEDLSERFAITDDEKPMFELCVDETMPDVFDVMKPLTSGIADAWYGAITGADFIQLNTKLVDLTGIENAEKYVVIRINDHEAYNPNTVKLVDSALRSSVEQGVLSTFYTRVTHPDITKLAASMFLGQLQALGQRILPLRKKTRFP